MNGAAIDLATLAELASSLGQERLDMMLDLLAAELEARPHVLRGALADCDFPRATAEAHGLKGVAANFGATGVAAAACSLEQAIAASAAGDRSGIAPALRALANAAAEARDALAALPRSRPLVA